MIIIIIHISCNEQLNNLLLSISYYNIGECLFVFVLVLKYRPAGNDDVANG